MPGEDERWLGVWERVTESVSRWAIGVVVIATIAGTTQGVTAWLLGSSFALGLGVIAGPARHDPEPGRDARRLHPRSGDLGRVRDRRRPIIMLVVVLVYQQVENNILTPKIQGKAVNLSGVLHHRRGHALRRAARGARRADRGAARGDGPDLRPGADEGPPGQGRGCARSRAAPPRARAARPASGRAPRPPGRSSPSRGRTLPPAR